MGKQLEHQADGPEITHMLRRAIHRIEVWAGGPMDKCPFPGICLTCHPRDIPNVSTERSDEQQSSRVEYEREETPDH